jgi:hypothetical protein
MIERTCGESYSCHVGKSTAFIKNTFKINPLNMDNFNQMTARIHVFGYETV